MKAMWKMQAIQSLIELVTKHRHFKERVPFLMLLLTVKPNQWRRSCFFNNYDSSVKHWMTLVPWNRQNCHWILVKIAEFGLQLSLFAEWALFPQLSSLPLFCSADMQTLNYKVNWKQLYLWVYIYSKRIHNCIYYMLYIRAYRLFISTGKYKIHGFMCAYLTFRKNMKPQMFEDGVTLLRYAWIIQIYPIFQDRLSYTTI